MDDVERVVTLRILQGVRIIEGFAALDHQVDGMGGLKPLAPLLDTLDERFEIAPVDELHHQEIRLVGDPDIEDLDDVGVLQIQGQLGLVQEHLDELFVLREIRQNALDRDVFLESLKRLSYAAKDLGHTALVQPLGDCVSITHSSSVVCRSPCGP